MLHCNVFALVQQCVQNRELIAASMRGDPIEAYRSSGGADSGGESEFNPLKDPQDKMVSLYGMNPVMFLFIVTLLVGLWVLGLFLLVTRWKVMPLWGRILGVFGSMGFIAGSVITIATAMISPEYRVVAPASKDTGDTD